MANVVWNSIIINSFVSLGLLGGLTAIKIQIDRIAAADEWLYSVPERSTSWDNNWDKREPSREQPIEAQLSVQCEGAGDFAETLKPSNAIRNIFLIRHGEYTKDNGKLTEKGLCQAQLTGEKLKELGYRYNATLFTSTMRRAIETSLKIRKNFDYLCIKRFKKLCEGSPIIPEPPPHSRSQLLKAPLEGARMEKAFRKYFHRANPKQNRDSYELVVCHANVIRYFVCRALQFPPEAWSRFSLCHCSITWIVIYPNGRVELKAFGDNGHLPDNMITN